MNPGLLAWTALPLYLAGLLKRRFLFAGCLAQAAYLLARGIMLGRIPLIGPHDTLIFLAASLVGFSAFFHASSERGKMFRVSLGAMAALFTVVAMLARPFEGPLPPVLRTYWFELHVGLSFFSYALFGIGAVLGIIYLGQREAALEKSQYRAILSGYLLFSLAMIAGGVWAYLAWGTYWLWTPKELWTSILWLYYSLYLHLRLRPGWYGKKAAIAGAIGFVVVLFTYLGVGLLMKSSHTF
ncbi:MAG: cytochrome c biogenesis protein CcsA [Nitrospiraceae bacterium]|nr:cytochrome c biogenesis protein CcsA [Nitrospiraceae bacterium]